MEKITSIESGRTLTVSHNNFIYIYFLSTRNLYKYDIYNNKYQFLITSDFAATNIYIIDNVSIDYKNNWGMGIADITATWIETGDVNSKSDLYKNGLIPTEV